MTNDKYQMTNKLSNSKCQIRKNRFDIYDRAFEFAIGVAKQVNKLQKSQAIYEYAKQVIRSSASVGANMEEADGALTKRDFINKMGIARREARESRYWLRLIKHANLFRYQEDEIKFNWLIKEAEEIMLILSSIINNTKKRN